MVTKFNNVWLIEVSLDFVGICCKTQVHVVQLNYKNTIISALLKKRYNFAFNENSQKNEVKFTGQYSCLNFTLSWIFLIRLFSYLLFVYFNSVLVMLF